MAWICLRSYLRPTEHCGACLAVPHHCEAAGDGAIPRVQTQLRPHPIWLARVFTLITDYSPPPPLALLTLVRIEDLQPQAPASSNQAVTRSTRLATITPAPHTLLCDTSCPWQCGRGVRQDVLLDH